MNFRSLAAPGIKAVKDNWRAIVFIQICFVAFVIIYYTVPSMQALPQHVENIRNKVGPKIFVVGLIWFVSIAVPEIAKRVTRTKADPITWRDLILRMVYFATIGLTVDALYTWMGAAYGNTLNFSTVAKKVLTDMFLYSPLVSMPLASITFGPVTMAMYSLPVVLNVPVAMAANAAWGIIVLAVGANATPKGELA